MHTHATSVRKLCIYENIIFLQGFHTPVAGLGRAGNIKNKGAVGEGHGQRKTPRGCLGVCGLVVGAFFLFVLFGDDVFLCVAWVYNHVFVGFSKYGVGATHLAYGDYVAVFNV